MEEIYDILFNQLEFGSIRNKIFDRFILEMDKFLTERKYNGSNEFLDKCYEYLNSNPEFTYSKFKFGIFSNSFCFYHQDYEDYPYLITNLKKFHISSNYDGSDAKDEWIFNERYLMYLITKIYKIENPKIAHKIESINEETSITSLKEENVDVFMTNDWNTIYEAEQSIDLDKVLEIKKKSIKSKTNEKFLINLLGLKEKVPEEFSKYKKYSCSFNDIFSGKNHFNKKTIIFHNEDTYFRFNLFQRLELEYNWGLYGHFYINFKLLRDCKRYERLERIAYFLSFLFPKNYTNYKTFFEEKIKNKIKDKLDCWPAILMKL